MEHISYNLDHRGLLYWLCAYAKDLSTHCNQNCDLSKNVGVAALWAQVQQSNSVALGEGEMCWMQPIGPKYATKPAVALWAQVKQCVGA